MNLIKLEAKAPSLQIHQDKHEGIFIQGLSEFQIDEFYDCYKLINKALSKRFIRQTSTNNRSSRSHSIFQILIEHKSLKKARLNLCDLAGSERINKNEVMNDDHIRQLKSINQSLSALGKVIYNLSTGGRNIAVFRQSKLTRVLQNSLTINTHTFIIGNVSPSKLQKQETLNTLRFLQRAKKINVKIRSLVVGSNSDYLVQKLQQQVIMLKNQLKVYPEKDIQDKMQKILSENQKLKQTRLNSQEVSHIIQENRKMKLLMDRIQYKQSQNPIRNEDQDFNNFQINIFPADLRKKNNNNKIDVTKRQLENLALSKNSIQVEENSPYQQKERKLRTLSLNEKYNRKQKNRIVQRLMELQKIQKINQQKLAKEIEAMNSEKYPKESLEKKLLSSAQQMQNYKKIMSYQRKIKELQARLLRNP